MLRKKGWWTTKLILITIISSFISESSIAEDFNLRDASGAGERTNVFLSAKIFYSLPIHQQKEYLVAIQQYLEAAEVVLASSSVLKKKSQNKQRWYNVLIPYAHANIGYRVVSGNSGRFNVGDQCIIGGYVGQWQKKGKGLSCRPKNGDDISCASTSERKKKIKCNPLVYGLDTKGNEFCVALTSKLSQECRLRFEGRYQTNSQGSINLPELKDDLLKIKELKSYQGFDQLMTEINQLYEQIQTIQSSSEAKKRISGLCGVRTCSFNFKEGKRSRYWASQYIYD